MGRIGTLASASLQPAFLPKQREHFRKQELFCMVFNQTSTKFGEDRGVKARIGEIQTQEIFPIDPSSYCICGLPIREVLYTLHDRNQGESPWSFGWLPFPGKDLRKILIGVDTSQDVAHLHVQIAFGVCCSCYTSGFLRNWTDRL